MSLKKNEIIDAAAENKKRSIFLILLISISVSVVALTSIYSLYRVSFEQERKRLSEFARVLSRFVEGAVNEHFVHGNPDWKVFDLIVGSLSYSSMKDDGFGKSGEFIIARKSGDSIVFLSKLKYLVAGIEKKIPIDSLFAEPMRRALIQKKGGVIVAKDYRGVNVIAAYEPIAVFDLGVVVKIDVDEFREPFLKAAVSAASISFFIIAIASFFVIRGNSQITNEIILYSRQLQNENAERHSAEEALAENERKLTAILENVGAGIFIKDRDYKYTYVNRKASEILGKTPGEIIGKTDSDFFSRQVVDEIMVSDKPVIELGRTVAREEVLDYGNPNSKRTFWAVKIPLFDSSGKVSAICGISTDITDIKQSDERTRRLNRALRSIASCSLASLRARSEQDLLSEICTIIVREGGYLLAWVGYAIDDERKSVKPVAHYGYDDGYLDTLEVTWNDTEIGRGPTGVAIRTGEPYVVQNIFEDPVYQPWKEQALKRGYSASIALPIADSSHVMGALNIYAVETDSFNQEEVMLLQRLASDLAFGISAIRLKYKNELAENALLEAYQELERTNEELKATNEEMEATVDQLSKSQIELEENYVDLRESNEKYNKLFELEREAVFLIDNETGVILEVNREASKMYGYSSEEMLGMKYSAMRAESENDEYNPSDDTGSIFVPLRYHINKDGTAFPVEITGRHFITRGRPVHVLAVRNISNRIRTEEELRISLQEKETLIKELYHRTKNNMQVISALLNIQASSINDERLEMAFKEMEGRIMSMSLVHQKLYGSKSLSRIDFSVYIMDLANNLRKSYFSDDDKISFNFHLESVPVTIETAIPCGLVINELLTNSFKHAFPDDVRGSIDIELRGGDNGQVKIVYSDCGIGLKSEFDFDDSRTLGFSLIRTLVKDQLGGELKISSVKGLVYEITFKDKNISGKIKDF